MRSYLLYWLFWNFRERFSWLFACHIEISIKFSWLFQIWLFLPESFHFLLLFSLEIVHIGQKLTFTSNLWFGSISFLFRHFVPLLFARQQLKVSILGRFRARGRQQWRTRLVNSGQHLTWNWLVKGSSRQRSSMPFATQTWPVVDLRMESALSCFLFPKTLLGVINVRSALLMRKLLIVKSFEEFWLDNLLRRLFAFVVNTVSANWLAGSWKRTTLFVGRINF